MSIHMTKGDTLQFGVGWLNKEDYGEGGFFIMFGYRYINFWKKLDITQFAKEYYE